MERLSIKWMTSDEAQQMPKKLVFAELPKTSTGKIQKFKLREMAEDL